VFIHPAVWREPFGMAVVEALAAGVPVIASRAGGLGEVVDEGRTGLLVPPGDAVALADAIRSLALNPARRAAMGATAQAETLRRFSWERVVELVERRYEAIDRNHPAGEGRARRRRRPSTLVLPDHLQSEPADPDRASHP
jgi:glycosyltransferase involved in cell wall biosynthesis